MYNKQKKTMRPYLFIIIVLLHPFWAMQFLLGQSIIQGRVTSQADGTPVPLTNINVLGSLRGTACDTAGMFELTLPAGEYQLKFSAMGFRSKIYSLNVGRHKTEPLSILLEPAIIEFSDEIVVSGEKLLDKIDDWLNSTDDILQKEESVSMIRRANFALEPSLRGMSAGRIGVVVDGMKIFSACVDRMDPVTAYVEVENLQKMDVYKGSFDMTKAASIGGTINMVTKKPDFNRPFGMQAETGYESISQLRRFRSELNYASKSFAARATFSIKKSDDYFAGGKAPIMNSGYQKNNYKLDFVNRFGLRHLLEFSFIGDNAGDIGYPALLMDARKTKSQIYRLEHKWNSPFPGFQSLNSMFYFNRIEHWMDDFQRDVTRRSVMPNMYMPMFGKTKTLGFIEEFKFTRPNHLLKVILDVYRLAAFADMKMISIFPQVSDMYVLNIGDAILYNTAVVLDYHWMLSRRWRWRSNLRVDDSNRDIRDENGRRLLSGFWNTGDIKQTYAAFSASAAIEYGITKNQTLQLALAQSERLPTHSENYGFYLYNYTDGYFYTGNPLLQPERSCQAEIVFERTTAAAQFRLNTYFNNIQNYISGLVQYDEFKVYSNISSAYIAGLEVTGKVKLGGSLLLNAAAAYSYGQNREFNEPLPYIPPFEGGVSLQYSRGSSWFSADSRFGSAQKRFASQTTLEDATDAFIILNLRSRIQLGDFLQIKLGVENAFDRFYHEHLSINNLPGRGRNFYLGFNYWISSR